MKYVIAGMDVAGGVVGDDVSDEAPYYELGWEVVTTHFDVKRMKRDGRLNPEADTIVTCSGREFLYTAEFRRVIDYRTFLRERRNGDAAVFCTECYAGGRLPAAYFDGDRHTSTSRYKYLDEDRDIIMSIGHVPVTHLHEGRSFGCLLVRRRSHAEHRNMSDETALFLLEKLLEKYHKVFLVGFGAERFENRPRVVHVDLRTYASLIQDDRCEVIIGSLTGTMQLAALVSRARTCLVLNHAPCDVRALNDPILLGRCITISTSQFFFIPPGALSSFFELCRL